jgi:hypothetical protein
LSGAFIEAEGDLSAPDIKAWPDPGIKRTGDRFGGKYHHKRHAQYSPETKTTFAVRSAHGFVYRKLRIRPLNLWPGLSCDRPIQMTPKIGAREIKYPWMTDDTE